MKKLTLLGTIVFVLMALPTSASATVFSGSQSDPAGDGPVPGQDLTRVEASYDDSGRIEFRLRLGAAPAGDLQLTAALGKRAANGGCSLPLLVIGTVFPDGNSRWLIEEDGNEPAEAEGEATRSVSGTEVRITATDSDLAGYKPDCAEAILTDPADPGVTYDHMAPFAVKPPPPRPRLKAKIRPVGSLRAGAAKAVTVRITNSGKAAARNVVVKAQAQGKASLKPRVRKAGAIRAGKSRTVRFTVKVNRRGKGKVRIPVTATGRNVKTRAATSFRIRQPKPPRRPVRRSGGLSGKMFWAFENSRWDRSPDLVGLYFTGPGFVRWGIPERSLPKCGKVTAKVRQGKMQPGCLRYSYNRRNGQVRIGKVRGTFRKGKLKLKMDPDRWNTSGQRWHAGLPARAGTRFRTSLINRGFYGACGITPFCRTWTEHLTLTRDGRFGRQDSSLSTGGGIGTGLPFVAIGKYGPENRGRYRVLPGNRIRFRYADGKTVTESLIIQTNKRGRPDPAREGLIVGATWFYRD